MLSGWWGSYGLTLKRGAGSWQKSQVARAQLEGRVREAERRVIEARQVIELQREELAAARTERERVSRSSLQLQGQMKQLQKQLSKRGESGSANDGQEATPLPSSGAIPKREKAMQAPTQRNQPIRVSGDASNGGDPGSREASASQS